MVDFNTDNSGQHFEAISRATRLGLNMDRLNLSMDLAAADGANGNPPIDWDDMLGLPDHAFLLTLVGIVSNMNRATGRLAV